MAGRARTNADHTRLISKSIFVTNFSDNTTAKDLWEVCKGYGNVVDDFIPNRKSKAGKRFAFVRFIKVENVDRLVGNLCTLWIGRMHLHANVVRFVRAPLQPSRPFHSARSGYPVVSSFVSVLKGSANLVPATSMPAIVIDDSCVVQRDLDNFVMGEVKQFASIANLRVLLLNEGFHNMNLTYLGGLWVMIELCSTKSKAKLLNHVGVVSWFSSLSNAHHDFVLKERIVWVDIEGVPLHAWSRATFCKIGSKWGEVLDLEECKDNLFARKWICIKTKQENNILEKFKIIVQGKVFVIRAKELFVWSSVFTDVTDEFYGSDDESDKGDAGITSSKEVNCHDKNLDDESNVDGVSDTIFEELEENLENVQVNSVNGKEQSSDPFNIYGLLRKCSTELNHFDLNSSFTHPPGFTPDKKHQGDDNQVTRNKGLNSSPCMSNGFSSRAMKDMEPVDIQLLPVDSTPKHNLRKGGSILEVLDGMIKVGQSMGFSMGGCLQDMENIICHTPRRGLDGIRVRRRDVVAHLKYKA
nr:RNA-directed DNA polymerase, eukaryota, nucleotide-binding alpha-beta plait domain protein [Tanacetum cinerariifolium]